ncbi:hypothetical protein MMG85_04255 [Pseudoxanthomonas sp. LH2527]|uniref:hypothetical protein n=1 Tax=Pseudoxanthomonas sp. LH2527 TaxID=2923249 RepID=UPI001F135DB6|nr:hypothetical protein [Pseudoxanthomonas sp. LH2527]MCH6482776.1 hypothetical protein [Pseudoxanthomonas sp. LH2527]
MRAGVILFTAWMLGASAVASANGNTTSDLGEIRKEQMSYRQQAMDKTGPFKDLSEPERQALIQKQNQLITLIDGKSTLGDLARDDQTTAINTLEWIKSAITRAEDERLVCERVKLVGSNRPTRICKTVAERRKEREEAEKSLEERKMCGAGCRGS